MVLLAVAPPRSSSRRGPMVFDKLPQRETSIANFSRTPVHLLARIVRSRLQLLASPLKDRQDEEGGDERA